MMKVMSTATPIGTPTHVCITITSYSYIITWALVVTSKLKTKYSVVIFKCQNVSSCLNHFL